MKQIRNDKVICFDVDDTLVMWSKDHHKPAKNRIALKDPYTNLTFYLSPHKVHIRLLKQFKGRGFTVVVWSKQGDRWCQEVVNKLEITDSVDLIMTKPDKYVDDKADPADIIGTRIYFSDSKDSNK